MRRRTVLQGLAGGATLSAIGSRAAAATTRARVVVIGGGFGGATAAKYIRLLSDSSIDVTLIEPSRAFVSCPVSNHVIGGKLRIADITLSYDDLRAGYGISIVHDTAAAIDLAKKTVRLAGGDEVRYDKLLVSPGAGLMFNEIEGLDAARADGRILQAWKAGAETEALRRQLVAMPDGGTFAIAIPEAPYRCPPGPYERACVVAAYLKGNKPRSKVLVLDANPDVVSKPALFKKAWADLYAGMVEYRPQCKATAVDARTMTIRFEVADDVKADVLNVLPPMRAGDVLVNAGLVGSGARWAPVNYRTFASTIAPDVHVVGDSIQPAPAMPKSAHMANGHAKIAAAAIVAELSGVEVDPLPMLTNTCYSFVSETEAMHVSSVHRYVEAEKTFQIVMGSGGVSAMRSEAEATYARGWARNIWADTFA
jgi:sulfide dehydrogenase [flavocytochrome c] flavoprotein subunit